MNILILSPFFLPNTGGVETHLNDLCEYLKTQGHKLFVLTYKPLSTVMEAASFERKENIEIRRFWWFPGLFYKLEPYPILDFLYLTPRLLIGTFFYLLKNNKRIDVIHAHGLTAAFIGNVMKKIFKKRLVVSTHATYELYRRQLLAKLVRITLSSADKILTLSEKSKEELVGIGLPEKRIDVYTYWIDLSIFKIAGKEEIKRKLDWQDNFVVLFVGRIIAKKGVNEFLKAAAALKNIKAVLIGDGNLSERVGSYADRFENIEYLGKVDNRLLPRYYNGADVVIVPSTHKEGFGRVILEALACGTPVIGANVGAIPEAMDESVGLLIKVTVENIKNSIEKLRQDRNLWERLQKNCRGYAEKHFSEKNAEIIVDSYRND